MDSFFALIDKLLPLLSTLLGAFITYYVTTYSKKNEMKINSQIKARDSYWIPCSMAIEKLKMRISDLTENAGSLVSFYGLNSCENETLEILKYLQADRRIYFYERTRNILKLLEQNIQIYEQKLDSDIKSIIKDFDKYYYDMLENFSVYKNNNCDECVIITKKSLPQDIKDAILTNKDIDWMGQVNSVYFYKGEFPYATSFSADMSYGSGDLYCDVWYSIQELGQCQENFGLTVEQELGIGVLNYEYEHIDKIGELLNRSVRNSNRQSEYMQIFETLALLQEEILYNIDRVTIL